MNGGGVKRDNNGRQGASNLYMYTLFGEREDGNVNYCGVCFV